MIKLTWDSRSKANLIANLSTLNLNIKSGAKQGLIETGKSIMATSVLEVPIDTGALVTSAYIEEPTTLGNSVSINFGYGGPNDKLNPISGEMASAYALEVHDNLQQNHPKGGKAKFLEDPVRASQMTFLDITGRQISFKFRDGIRP